MTSKQRRAASFVRLARECSRDSWQHSQGRAEFLRVKAQAMTEARALFLVG